MLTNSTVMLSFFRARPLRAALKIGYLRPRCMAPTKHCGRDEQRHRRRGHHERQRRVGILVRQQQRRRAAAVKAAAALASPAAGPRGSGGPWPLSAGGRSRGPPAVGCGRPGCQRLVRNGNVVVDSSLLDFEARCYTLSRRHCKTIPSIIPTFLLEFIPIKILHKISIKTHTII